MATIYEPKGAAREYSPLALNYFTGCDLGCKTCYVPIFLKYYQNKNYVHSEVKMKDEKTLLTEIENSCKKFKNSEKQVMFSFLTDPYTHFNDQTKTTRKVLELFLKYNIPVSILSKSGTRMLQDLDIFKQFGKNMQIGSSLTFTNPDDSLKWESFAALPEDRFEAMETIHNACIRTWASIEPVIIPEQSLEIMEVTHSYVDAYKIGKLNHFGKQESKVDWTKFLSNAVSIMRKHNKLFYIKKDLLKFKPRSLYLNPEETNMDFLAIRNSNLPKTPFLAVQMQGGYGN